ncbi:hypothetical protein M231_04663 [Tremella mesenterica]|uniref:Uncharacterized protein n=1 Tax=Tremella mesenterica TaxID=5217 RepID=A0A4Q1BK40_TREME|nr:uncharacterized protein TREMEDRAFT_62698 [Tremella mesenterica DSM 1558]EIW68982.1 hypothetical protein TREMEDRAFT_62698 [Tremella mesenterica DSM 1558]RXK38104.1 hypothetical protein M231_04663 [Tremella mesenterica]
MSTSSPIQSSRRGCNTIEPFRNGTAATKTRRTSKTSPSARPPSHPSYHVKEPGTHDSSSTSKRPTVPSGMTRAPSTGFLEQMGTGGPQSYDPLDRQFLPYYNPLVPQNSSGLSAAQTSRPGYPFTMSTDSHPADGSPPSSINAQALAEDFVLIPKSLLSSPIPTAPLNNSSGSSVHVPDTQPLEIVRGVLRFISRGSFGVR